MTQQRTPPPIEFPIELPISARRDELIKAIAANQVLIVAGETGSGKSTQLPKLCLAAGRGADKRIGHTQPRRLAARTLAERVASELGTQVGDVVGYAMRFTDQVSASTSVKFMTDGICLAEIQRDPDLKQYDTLIIDEAHERSLNIDFLLGYLQQLVQRRKDLHVVITSATIDTARFAKHFNNAPIIEVSGRTHPVEMRYRPLVNESGDTIDQIKGICHAAEELWRDTTGDILVFCPGERDINEAREALNKLSLFNCEILPLYARLSAAEQQRVFKPHTKRRIILATNVAETSVTVPAIGSVIDVGTARISRYSKKTKVQRLPIEAVSQASANQRAGRCGRLGPGVCIRLYSEESFIARAEFTDPEIRRTNLAAVILQMAAARLGNIESFPFIDKPDSRSIADGKKLLEELGAINPKRSGSKKWLTGLGRKLARLPIDVRLGRMLLAAERNGSLHDMLIITSGLAVMDPRERPKEKRGAADEFHSRFANKESDFMSLLSLWNYLQKQKQERSGNQFRKMCRREFLNYMRVREWFDTHHQLTRSFDAASRKQRGGKGRSPIKLGMTKPSNTAMTKPSDTAMTKSGDAAMTKPSDRGASSGDNFDAIHQAIITGLLSHIGTKDTKPQKRNASGRPALPEYLGTRQLRFRINPSSGLKKTAPDWVVAAELVDTSAIWARTVAKIDPQWIEDAATHLVKKSYGEPFWDSDSGAAYVRERVTLLGLTLAADRRRLLRHINKAAARQQLLHYGFVNGEWNENHHSFLAHNTSILEEVNQLYARQRQDNTVGDDELYEFYDRHIPHDVTSVGEFNRWWKETDTKGNKLRATVEDFLDKSEPVGETDDDGLPTSWLYDGTDLELRYVFDPTSDHDGVSVLVPLEVLPALTANPFTWSVSGFRDELIIAMLRSLPKPLRRELSPLADTASNAAAYVEKLVEGQPDAQTVSLATALSNYCHGERGVTVDTDDFVMTATVNSLLPTFRIIDADFTLVDEGKNLDDLKQQLAATATEAIESLTHSELGGNLERNDLASWDFDELPKQVSSQQHGQQVTGYPALFDEGKSVAIKILASEDEQFASHFDGVRRLLYLGLSSPLRSFDKLLTTNGDPKTLVQLAAAPVQSKAGWYIDAIDCALDHCLTARQLPWDKRAFAAIEHIRDTRYANLEKSLAQHVLWFVGTLATFENDLAALTSPHHSASVADVRNHIARLFYPGFLAGIGYDRLEDLQRYASAISKRIDDLASNPRRDQAAATACQQAETAVAQARQRCGFTEQIEELTWLAEELRVASFAPSLGSTHGISSKKIRRRADKL